MIHSEMIQRMTIQEFNERIMLRSMQLEEHDKTAAVPPQQKRQQSPQEMIAILRNASRHVKSAHA